MPKVAFILSMVLGEGQYQIVFTPFSWLKYHIFNTEDKRINGQTVTIGPFQLSVTKALNYIIDSKGVEQADKDKSITSKGTWT